MRTESSKVQNQSVRVQSDSLTSSLLNTAFNFILWVQPEELMPISEMLEDGIFSETMNRSYMYDYVERKKHGRPGQRCEDDGRRRFSLPNHAFSRSRKVYYIFDNKDAGKERKPSLGSRREQHLARGFTSKTEKVVCWLNIMFFVTISSSFFFFPGNVVTIGSFIYIVSIIMAWLT